MNIKLLYPNALLTAKILPIPEEGFAKGGRRVLKYTKHYYIGSERIASFLGTKQSVGLYCTSETTLIPPMDAKVLEAGDALGDVFAHFDKTFDLDTPYLYGSNSRIICAPAQITQGFGGYWYHPDHLGSSSYITNLHGEISQHMEYLPFGETLVEEHLNSNNSPYKFNAKEYDSETGNYYYGARYYSPKYNLMLSVDPAYEMYPGVSPFAYTLQNPVRYVDPTGMFVEDNDDIIIRGKNSNEITIPTADDDHRYIDIPFDIQESRTLDLGLGNINTNNIAVGYSVGVSAEASLVFGGELSGNVTVVNFPSNSDYNGYNYVYAEGEIKGSGGMQQSASVNVEANFFIAYSNYEGNRKPESFQGKTSTYGLSFNAKKIVGGGISFYGFQSEDKRWTGIGVGLSGGAGVGGKVGAWSRGEASSVMLSNQKPTIERSRMDRIINKSGFLPMVSQALFQYIKK